MDALGIAVFLALTGWVLAGLAAWAATEWRTEVDRQRRARDRADYAAHKAEQRITDLQAKCDALLVRMGRKQGPRTIWPRRHSGWPCWGGWMRCTHPGRRPPSRACRPTASSADAGTWRCSKLPGTRSAPGSVARASASVMR